MIKYMLHDWIKYPGLLGFDGAGVVEELGEGVTHFKKGDKILFPGSVQKGRGTFQQYSLVTAEFAAKIPDDVSVDEAASIPLTLAVPWMGFFAKKKESGVGGGAELTPFWTSPRPYHGHPIVVIGGGTSVGQFAIQLAKLSGFSPIITTASLKHTPFLTFLGATHVLSRDLPTEALAVEIAKITSTPLKVVFAAAMSAETQTMGYGLLAPGGQLLSGPKAPGLDLPPNQDGKSVVQIFGSVYFPGQEDLGREMYYRLTQLLADGSIKPNRIQVLPNGLRGIPEGLEQLREGKISGTKLIAHPQETA
ncbi:GroES-like protein, partial [Punctularia strigosozonata HHB-11173 SS5]|uniref:GroES-like protein n=1 Tax=Punctularia strigosozonata (strain HHB-11173) TaxID=741275 RepID=UPI00044177AB